MSVLRRTGLKRLRTERLTTLLFFYAHDYWNVSLPRLPGWDDLQKDGNQLPQCLRCNLKTHDM
jgi:hypothetical protein